MHRNSTWKVRDFISDLSDIKYKNHNHVHISLFFQHNIILLSSSCKSVVLRVFTTLISPGSLLEMHMTKPYYATVASAKSLQSCPTLCDPIDGSPPGSPVPGILQARTLEWVAISFSNAWKWKVKVKSLSRVQLFATPWTAAYQAPLSMELSRQEYWSGVPLASPKPYSDPLNQKVCDCDPATCTLTNLWELLMNINVWDPLLLSKETWEFM